MPNDEAQIRPVARTLRFPPSRDALLVEEARRQGISVAAVIEQALIARGIFPGVDRDPD